MSNIDIIRAWKDEEYCRSLTEEQRSKLPENPAGMIELSDADMESVAGGSAFICGGDGGIDISDGGCVSISNGDCNDNDNNNNRKVVIRRRRLF